MVAGGAYAVHKHHQHEEEEQYAQGQADAQEYEAQAAPEAAGDDSVAQLTQLKSLLDSGALTQSEFEAEKQKIIGG
jgi:hypothetical protein